MKGTKDSLLRHDLIKVMKRRWPDITMTPWFLVYRNIHSALLAAGFSSIIDETSRVPFTSFQKNSSHILKLCSESFLARSRLNDGGQSTRSLKNPVSALRRELRSVFGIKLNLERAGRGRSKTYMLAFPMELIDFASSSTLFQDAALPQVIRAPQPEIRLTTFDNKSVSVSHNFLHFPPKGRIIGTCVVNHLTYNMVDFGGKGNCLFCAVAGALRAIHPSSVTTHYSLRYQVSEWYLQHGLQHQAILGVKPSDVILDNPNQPPPAVFETWTWVDWGHYIANDGIWGGATEIMALNAVLPDGFRVNIYDSVTRVTFGSEHNTDGDTVLLVRFGSAHYTALQRLDLDI